MGYFIDDFVMLFYFIDIQEIKTVFWLKDALFIITENK